MRRVFLPRSAASSLTATALATAACLAGAAAPAHAAVTDATCVGSTSAHYTPGLTLTQQSTTVQAQFLFNGCTGTDASATAGSADRTVTTALSCLTPEVTGPGSITIRWSNGASSDFAFNRTLTHVGGQSVVTFLGQITSGEFSGDSATLVATSPNLNLLDCLAPTGVTNTAGVVTLEIATL
ncbi:MAG: hypothetical protein HOV83_15195 [Catenulispora sp.]|nr:hypothetical protein [Catenulispora sp.]